MVKNLIHNLFSKFLHPKIKILLKELSYKVFKVMSVNIQDPNTINKDSIKDYAKKNILNTSLYNLLKGMDIKSKIVVEASLARILNNSSLLFEKNFSKSELVDFRSAFGPYLFENQNNIFNSLLLFKQRYPGYDVYGHNCYKYHHGLRLFDQKVFDYIKDGDFIDGGSYNLESAIVLNTNYLPKKIYSFELDKNNYLNGIEILKKYYPDFKNIISINKGLWDSKKIIDIDALGNEASRVVVSKDLKKIEKAEVTDLDSFVKENKLNVKFIKLDVEGAEYNTIVGSKNTIKENTPVMSISIYHNLKDFFEIKPLIESIAPNTYEFYIRRLAPCYSLHETCLLVVPKKLEAKILEIENVEIYG